MGEGCCTPLLPRAPKYLGTALWKSNTFVFGDKSRTTTRVATPLPLRTVIIYYCEVANIKNRNITCLSLYMLFPFCVFCSHDSVQPTTSHPSASESTFERALIYRSSMGNVSFIVALSKMQTAVMYPRRRNSSIAFPTTRPIRKSNVRLVLQFFYFLSSGGSQPELQPVKLKVTLDDSHSKRI